MRKQKRRGLIYGLMALVLAILTGFLFTSRIDALQRQIGDMQQVVVVKTAIAPRTLITADMLETRSIPRAYAHPSYIQSMSDVVNQRVAVVSLTPDMILRQNDVAPTSGLNDGTRAISIGVNPVSVSVDKVVGGSRVDVIVSYETSEQTLDHQETKTKRTRTLLSDVEVLEVAGAPITRPKAKIDTGSSGNTTNQSSSTGLGIFGSNSDTSGTGNSDTSLNTPYGLRDKVVIVTLKVKPEDAQLLAYQDTFATDIRLSLRRSDDREIKPLSPTNEEDFR
ncbi:MAG: Flp pilus assembly protein CpaB [Herpetosiphonaceae bacterium]|nr:Flp pilus assembly protein CpaB [Herpetosiphonaceae bacterium]